MINIRHIKAEDKDAFYHLVQNNKERLADYFPITIEKAATPEIAAASINMYNMLLQQNELYTLMLETQDDQQLIGIIFIKNIDQKTKKCELGYFIDKDAEGKGMMSFAVKNALDMAFNKLNLNKVYCRIDVDNARSNNIMLKNGFKLEGVLRQDFCKSDGNLVDLNYYGLLKNDVQ